MKLSLGRFVAIVVASGLAAAGCEGASGTSGPPRELSPAPNPLGPEDPLWGPQPHRDRPSAVVASPDGSRLYVALTGTEDDPGREIAIVDATTLETIRRVRVGPAPTGLALHPEGRFLIVTNRFARFASIVDTVAMRVVREVDVPYYTESVALTPDGRRAFFTNRWKDSILRWDVEVTGSRIAITPLDVPSSFDAPAGIPVPINPDLVRVTPDGARVLVASETALRLTVLDASSGDELGTYAPSSPVLDVAVVGPFLIVLHTGQGANHPPDTGFDGDGDKEPGDGTANVGFQDVQNEIDVVHLDSLERAHRYTSDTICCRDFRDVDPGRPMAGYELGSVDEWHPDRLAFLPPRETWIVAGAMPERVVPFVRGDGTQAIAVVYGGSSEVQTFDVDVATGALAPRELAPSGLHRTGHGAFDAAIAGGPARLVVVDRLGESLTALDLDAPPVAEPQRAIVGDVTGGPFPSTDAELGEAFNTMTALFTVDGDQTCVHCHRDGTPIGKPVSMPLLVWPEWGVRLVMSYRNGYDGRPWFLEAAMDETNFFPVINEFARKENFCCEQNDRRIWSRYPTRDACAGDPTLAGCNHVQRCVDDPPPECAHYIQDPGREPTRDRHFRRAAARVFGRDTTFGDVLYTERLGEGGTIERRPIPLGFDAITRALGLFLVSRPRALPNPNEVVFTARAELGRAIYHSPEAGCASCHPLPIGATARSTAYTTGASPITFPYVVTPLLDPTGRDVDVVTSGFLGTFPLAAQTEGGLRIGVPSVRGAWDRSLFLHHGRARSLREVLATPGHAALRDGERGLNERFGQPDTHGGTSHLSAEELDALVAFVETL